MKITSAQIAIGLVCFVLAFTITLQMKSVKRNSALNMEQSTRVSTLQAELKNEKQKSEDLYKSLVEHKNELESYKKASLQSGDISKALATQLEKTEIMAGYTSVEGSGVIISLTDNPKASTLPGDANDYILHDMDLLSIINELRAAGAEAISFGTERVVNSTEIRCLGPVVSVNSTRFGSPFEISAIGDPANLESALNFLGGPIETLRSYGMEITIRKSNSIKMEPFKGSRTFKYATPVKSVEKEGN